MIKTKLLQYFKDIKCIRKYGDKVKEKCKFRKVLIVAKCSRYESERQKRPDLNESQLEQHIRDRGADYDTLIHSHKIHKNFENRIVKSFENIGVEIRRTNRLEFRTSISKDVLNWADILVPVGGDGTFLLAAGRAKPLFAQSQRKIPIVGFNSDPEHSEGRLMLPKQYSENPEDAVKKICSGDFRFMHRSRIRTTLLVSNGEIPVPIDLHRHTVTRMEREQVKPELLSKEMAEKYNAKVKVVLPYLALNEVFIGENVSARVSHLQVVINHSEVVNKTKCSGMCVSTGTGSTSWHHSINRLTVQQVEDLLNTLNQKTNESLNVDPEEIANLYNQNLLFSPDAPHLCYSIREQISVGVWPSPKSFASRCFVSTIFIKSKCVDASLVMDGSIAYPFNDGAKALLEIYPEDTLLTIVLD